MVAIEIHSIWKVHPSFNSSPKVLKCEWHNTFYKIKSFVFMQASNEEYVV